MPFVNDFVPVNFINKSVTPTGTPDLDATWLNYLQSEMDQIGDGLATYSSDLETLEATVSALGNPYTDPTFITGLKLEFISLTSIRVTSGACYVPATGNIASKATDTTITLTGLAANTWYYMYAADVGGTTVFDAPSTTVPVVYMGTAKQKSGDSSRRLVGAIRTAATSTNVIPFRRVDNKVLWQPRSLSFWDAPLLAINAKTTATVTTVTPDAAPSGCRMVQISGVNTANQDVVFGDPSVLSTTVAEMWIRQTANAFTFDLSLNDSGQFGCRFVTAATANSMTCGVTGYYLER